MKKLRQRGDLVAGSEVENPGKGSLVIKRYLKGWALGLSHGQCFVSNSELLSGGRRQGTALC